MHSKVFVVEYLNDKEKHDPVDEDIIFRELPSGADYATEFSLDQYCEKDFEPIFYGCTASVEKKDNGFLVTLDREKLRKLFIKRSRILEKNNKEFRRRLKEKETGLGPVNLYALSNFIRDEYGFLIWDTMLEYSGDLNSWMCDKLMQATRDGCDTIQFLVTRIFDWHY